MPFGSRPYQVEGRDAALETFASGVESTMMVLPTGTGKTVLSAMLIEEFHARTGRRALFLAHRETLVTQAFEKFTSFGLDVSVEMAGQDATTQEALFGKSQVVVGSVQTMQGTRLQRFPKDEFGLIIVDEGHHAVAKQHRNAIDYFDDKCALYVTATPKPSMGSFVSHKCFEYPITTAIWGSGDDKGGWLVPPKILKSMVSIDLRGLKATGGEYNLGDLEERLGPRLNEIADAIHAQVGSRQTVVFMPDVGTSQGLADLLQDEKYGRACEYVSGTGGRFGMSFPERKDKLARFDAGETQILVCNELLIEGWDCPSVKCVVIARPTSVAMLYRYIQMVGRGLRPAPETGFDDCLVLDLDWQADDAGKGLSMVVDLFNDDSRSDDVMRVAREIEKSLPKDTPKDAIEIIEEAEEIVRLKTRLKIKVDPRVIQVKTVPHDPLGASKMLDVKFTKRYDMDTRGDNPASDAQVGLLKSLGIDRPDGVSKWGATKLIKRLLARKEGGLATVGQVKALLERGVDPGVARALSVEAARNSLVELGRAAEIGKQSQGSLF